jgi:hypothetical protein
MTHTNLLFLLLMTLPSVATSAEDNVWKTWARESHQQCPANHLSWISGGLYDELLDGFIHTLPSATQRKISSIADYSHRCSEVTAGFSCEMGVHLDAFNKLGLMKRFAAFACHQYKCTEPALCTRIGSEQRLQTPTRRSASLQVGRTGHSGRKTAMMGVLRMAVERQDVIAPISISADLRRCNGNPEGSCSATRAPAFHPCVGARRYCGRLHDEESNGDLGRERPGNRLLPGRRSTPSGDPRAPAHAAMVIR